MSPQMTRRQLLQWLGGATAGCMLSPMPFALIDDLTIATQTRGRPRALPDGDLGRFRTRCPGCPAGCEIEVLTVGGQPYLCVPAAGAERIGACAVLPALHQLRLHRRLAGPQRAGQGDLDAGHARDLVVQWIGESDRIAGVDFAAPGHGVTPLSVLMASIPGSLYFAHSTARPPLAALERRLGLAPDLELALDPSRIRRIVPIGPGSRAEDPALRSLAAAVEQFRRGEGPDGLVPGTVVLSPRDGVGARLDPRVEEIAVAANLVCCAPDAHGPIVARRRLPSACIPSADLEDQSLELLLVDASRAWQVIPWQRLRRKLIPGRGRLVVFTPWAHAAIARADLALPTAAPLEIEEFAGGDDRHPELRLALTRPVAAPRHPLVGPEDVARQLDPDVTGAVEATARAILADPDGHLCDPVDQSLHPVPSDPGQLLAALREGQQWRGSISPLPAIPEVDPIDTVGVASTVAAERDRIRIRLDAPVFAAAGVPLPPVLGKLSRESRLVAPAGTIRAHPRTLGRLGLTPGSTRRIRTNRGEIPGRLVDDPSVEADALVAVTGFDPDGFATQPAGAGDLLGRIDFDPALDRPGTWTLEEVI